MKKVITILTALAILAMSLVIVKQHYSIKEYRVLLLDAQAVLDEESEAIKLCEEHIKHH